MCAVRVSGSKRRHETRENDARWQIQKTRHKQPKSFSLHQQISICSKTLKSGLGNCPPPGLRALGTKDPPRTIYPIFKTRSSISITYFLFGAFGMHLSDFPSSPDNHVPTSPPGRTAVLCANKSNCEYFLNLFPRLLSLTKRRAEPFANGRGVLLPFTKRWRPIVSQLP
jgi:hypothetical protein